MLDTLAAAAALLLGVSGLAKLRHPGPAASMLLRLLRRPARQRRQAAVLVRVTGTGELTVGAAVLLTGSRATLVLMAAGYLAFAVVAVALLRTRSTNGASCGCFGRAASPVGPAHLLVDVAACAAGLAAAARPPGPGAGLLDGGAAVALTGAGQAVLLAALAYLSVTSLPALLAARRAPGLEARSLES